MVTNTTPQTDDDDDDDTDEHAVTCYELDSKSLLLLVGAPHQQLFEYFGRQLEGTTIALTPRSGPERSGPGDWRTTSNTRSQLPSSDPRHESRRHATCRSIDPLG